MEVLLDNQKLSTHTFQEEREKGKIIVTIEFKVTSEDYHAITTLLYKGSFFVEVPEKNLEFHGKIKEYSTSITNLYEKDQVGNFFVVLEEEK